MKPLDFSFKVASTESEFEDGRNLFRLYAKSLPVDLSYQDFEGELKTIHEQYNKPKGALILSYQGVALPACLREALWRSKDVAQRSREPVACGAIRAWQTDIAELKRMFVVPEYRKFKLGMRLLERCLDVARQLHYRKIRLDTLPTMIEAQNLYRKFGFYEIEAYRFSPVEGTVFMETLLD